MTEQQFTEQQLNDPKYSTYEVWALIRKHASETSTMRELIDEQRRLILNMQLLLEQQKRALEALEGQEQERAQAVH